MVALLIGVSQDNDAIAQQWGMPQRSPQVVSGNLQAIAQVLQQQILQQSETGQLSQSQITELINPSPEKMRQSIERLFRDQSGAQLRLFYFCGSATIGKTGKLYLSVGTSEAASQTQGGQFWTTEPKTISLDWVLELMEKSYGEKVVAILDCVDVINEKPEVSEKISCRSFTKGALLSHLTLEPNKISQKNLHRKALLEQLEELTRQGEFPTYTDYLVTGLATGEADLDEDGVISLGEWHEYAKNQLQIFAPTTVPKIYAVGNSPEMPIATISHLSNDNEYRHTVAEFAKRHDGSLPVVVQRSLDVRRDRLGVTQAIATSIQKTVLAPYRYKQAKLQLYQQLWQAVMEKPGAVSPETRDRLKSQQVVLGLTDAEVAAISQPRPKSSSSDDLVGLPWPIVAAVAIALLFGGGTYALVSHFIEMRSPQEICSQESSSESCLTSTNEPKPSVTLPPPPTDIATEPVNSDLSTNQFHVPTKEPITLTDHAGSVQAVAIAPDRQILVTGSADKTIKLWNLARVWQPQKPGDRNTFLTGTLRGHTGRVRSLAISPDSQTLASGSNDRTIKLWNLAPEVETRGYGRDDESAYLQETLTDHVGAVYALTFLPNQNILISGSGDWTIKIWDLTTKQAIKTLRGHQGSVRALAVSPDGHTLVSGGNDGTVKVWDLRTRELKQTLRGHTDLVRTVAISPDGRTIASGSWDKTIKIWTLQPQMEIGDYNQDVSESRFSIATLTGHTNHVNSVVFSPDGQTLISGSDDNTIKVWQLHLERQPDPENGNSLASLQATLTDHSSDILSLAVSGYNWQYPQSYPLLVSGSWDRTVKIWW